MQAHPDQFPLPQQYQSTRNPAPKTGPNTTLHARTDPASPLDTSSANPRLNCSTALNLAVSNPFPFPLRCFFPSPPSPPPNPFPSLPPLAPPPPPSSPSPHLERALRRLCGLLVRLLRRAHQLVRGLLLHRQLCGVNHNLALLTRKQLVASHLLLLALAHHLRRRGVLFAPHGDGGWGDWWRGWGGAGVGFEEEAGAWAWLGELPRAAAGAC